MSIQRYQCKKENLVFTGDKEPLESWAMVVFDSDYEKEIDLLRNSLECRNETLEELSADNTALKTQVECLTAQYNELKNQNDQVCELNLRLGRERDALNAQVARLKIVNKTLLDALEKAEFLLGFHEGSAKPEFDGAHPTIRVAGEDWQTLLGEVRAAIQEAK